MIFFLGLTAFLGSQSLKSDDCHSFPHLFRLWRHPPGDYRSQRSHDGRRTDEADRLRSTSPFFQKPIWDVDVNLWVNAPNMGHIGTFSGNSWMMIWSQKMTSHLHSTQNRGFAMKIWGHLTPKRQQFCTLLALWFPCVLQVHDFFFSICESLIKSPIGPWKSMEIPQKFELPDALRLCCHSLILTPRSSVFGVNPGFTSVLVKHGETRWWN